MRGCITRAVMPEYCVVAHNVECVGRTFLLQVINTFRILARSRVPCNQTATLAGICQLIQPAEGKDRGVGLWIATNQMEIDPVCYKPVYYSLKRSGRCHSRIVGMDARIRL